MTLDKGELGDAVIYAKYYFDGDPAAIFRIRLYALRKNDDGTMNMNIFRLCDKLEKDLRDSGHDCSKVDWMGYSTLIPIPECDILWSRPKGTHVPYFEGVMKDAKIFSPRIKQYLTVKDELTLSETHLSVNDRGIDEEVRRILTEGDRPEPCGRSVRATYLNVRMRGWVLLIIWTLISFFSPHSG